MQADELRAAVRRVNAEGALMALFAEYVQDHDATELQISVQHQEHGPAAIDVQVMVQGRPVFGESL